jgi:cobalt-zinc-cadmium efflux system membrane fusion protein
MKKSILYSLLLIFLVSCSNEAAKTEKGTEKSESLSKTIELSKAQLQSNAIRLGKVEQKFMGATIDVNGSVEIPPTNKSAISFPFGGFVSSVSVLDGMHVKKGQVLMTIEDPALIQLQQDYMDAYSQLQYLKADYDRQKELGTQGANSGKAVQLAQANYQSGRARVEGLKLKLELAGLSVASVQQGKFVRKVPVKAPFNGVVTGMFAEVGKYAGPSDVLMEIIDTKHTHIELFVFEKDIPFIRLGQRVELTVNGQDESITAKVYLIGKAIGTDRRVKVHCHLDKEQPNLLSGTFVQAKIHLEEQRLRAVPVDAVVNYEGEKYLLSATETSGSKMRFEMIQIRVLAEENGWLAIQEQKSGIQLINVVYEGANTLLSTISLKMQPNE